MSRLEAARTELEAVRTEVERLQAENVKLREARPEQAEAVDRAAEVERLKELYAQALRDIQAKDEQVETVRHELDDTRQRLKRQETAAQELQSKCQALEETCDTVHAQVSRARQEGELERLRAVESERAKCMGGTRSQVGRTTAGGRGKSWPVKFATYAGSTIRIDGGSAHPHAIISGGSSYTPTTNGASSPRKPKQCSSPRKPKQRSSPRKPKQWREWCECGGACHCVVPGPISTPSTTTACV